ncbi:ABC transporter ATP-binding protein [Salidesulfovibrio onnuriiensis]|uniref:ABC transporter ATP-binding protein n=1 Tax=Salidesulfovibrio onnuriiensis TaxID=2583823 RepID=UPI0011CC2701|nr:ABC transporter ATP-binding protein [Salidesulfovibrio onnuriiensis]
MADAYRLANVAFGYGETPVIKDLDLTISRGALTAVVGPNGSGKSTLLDIMAGFRRPQAGRVELLGKSLTDLGQRELARLTAMAPQEFGFTFPFTVREAVLMGRHPHIPRFSTPSEQDKTHVEAALEIMDLEKMAGRSVSELSGGERQRTVLARTLAQQAPVMLLDEPTSSMDIRHALATMRELKRLAGEEGRTVITVLHDLNLAASFADHVVLLRGGAVLAQGPMRETLTPENVRAVFGVDCAVRWDNFAGSLSVTYRLEP